VFHGYAMRKRIEKIDDHFTLRGWFDIYCTQGLSSTPYFKELEARHGYFKVYETGWCKVDPFFEHKDIPPRKRPVILYSPTFSRRISSAPYLVDTIAQLAETRSWDWIITFHPKLDDPALIARYEHLADRYPHVTFSRVNEGLTTFRQADVMLCDSSSIIVEFMLLEKPVVTFRNTHPGDFLVDVQHPEEISAAIELALTKPEPLMANIRSYTAHHEAHRDGQNSSRVLDAVDDFMMNYAGRIRSKPLNLFRKFKLRMRLKYYRF
jgi:CDP-glycerol glycerophosphotransferase (TagB/SpsB family)